MADYKQIEDHYRKRAEEARAEAARSQLEKVRARHLEAARVWDELAEKSSIVSELKTERDNAAAARNASANSD